MQIKFGVPTVVGVLFGASSVPALWNGIKWALDWKGRYDAATAIGNAEFLSGWLDWQYSVAAFMTLAIAASLIWWDSRRSKREITIEMSPFALALIATALSVFAWSWFFYDRSKGPIIWTWGDNIPLAINGSSEPGSANIFGIQLVGKNRGEDPISPTNGYVESKIDGTKYPLTFSRRPLISLENDRWR